MTRLEAIPWIESLESTDKEQEEAKRIAIEALRHQEITQAIIKVDFSEEDKRQLVKEVVEKLKYEKAVCIPNEYAQDATTCGNCACYDRQFSYCNKLGVTFADDDYCSYFEQKEEQNNDRRTEEGNFGICRKSE